MQLNLGFPEAAEKATPVWDEFDPDARRAFLQTLARAIAQAVRPQRNDEPGENRDDR
jgi:hypothetical protein